jgi:hypothetical protein
MSPLAAIACLCFIFEDSDLFVFTFFLCRSHYLRPFYGRRTNSHFVGVSNEKDFIQVNGLSDDSAQTFYGNSLPWSYLVLFSTGFNNSVNFAPPLSTIKL